MKRLISIIAVILCITVLFTACQTNTGNGDTSDTNNSQSNLPVYVPGSVCLEEQDQDDYTFERNYRITYYRVWGEFLELLTDEQSKDFDNWFINRTVTGNDAEMLLLTMIKRYNIPREQFDKAAKKFEESHKDYFDENGRVLEEYEVPNGDILYTFDDNIIREYYRYE